LRYAVTEHERHLATEQALQSVSRTPFLSKLINYFIATPIDESSSFVSTTNIVVAASSKKNTKTTGPTTKKVCIPNGIVTVGTIGSSCKLGRSG
jgi:hypothetical protein